MPAGQKRPENDCITTAPAVKCQLPRHRLFGEQPLTAAGGSEAATGTPGIAPDESDWATGPKVLELFSAAISGAAAEDFPPDCLNYNKPVRR